MQDQRTAVDIFGQLRLKVHDCGVLQATKTLRYLNNTRKILQTYLETPHSVD